METVLFCLLFSALVLRKSASDVPFMIRGKTPPSHELRMAELRHKEQAETRKVASRAARAEARHNRRHPGQDYARALYHHAVDQALERRRTAWLTIDPVKAERYARKLATRAERLRERQAARDCGEKVGLARKVATARAGATDWLRRNKFISEPAKVPTEPSGRTLPLPTPPAPLNKVGAGVSRPADSAPPRRLEPEAVGPASDEPADITVDGSAFAGDSSDAEPIGVHDDVTHESRPGVDRDGAKPGIRTPGAGSQIPTQEGNRVSATTGETTTLSQTIASIEAWEAETKSAMGSLEYSLASLEGAEVGPSVTSAIGEAREAFSTAAAAFAKAKAALEPSQQIGDMYRSAPDAGSKEFVQN